MFCKPCFGGPSFVSPAATGPVATTPPVVHPTKYCETHSFQTTVVPHIHPSHTTLVNHQMVQNQHYFPHTQSAVNTLQQTDVPGYGPVPQVAGAMTGPYGGSPYGPGVSPYGGSPYGPGVSPYGPGVSPYGPGVSPYGPTPQVAGAMTGPGGMPGMVAGAATGPMGPNANPMLGGLMKK